VKPKSVDIPLHRFIDSRNAGRTKGIIEAKEGCYGITQTI
jgi:hypothetical protein